MEEPHLLLGERGFISPLGNPSRSLALLKLASARVIKYFMDLLDRRGFQDKSAPIDGSVFWTDAIRMPPVITSLRRTCTATSTLTKIFVWAMECGINYNRV